MGQSWIDIIMDSDGSQRRALHESDFFVKHAIGLANTYETLAYRKEPNDLVGKIFYWAGIISQLVLGLITQPFGIAAFLLEESAQSMGMGAYLLFTSKDWETLNTYLPVYGAAMETYEPIARSFALLNPIGAGAVIVYMQAAKQARAAMGQAMLFQLQQQAMKLGVKNWETMDSTELVEIIKLTTASNAAAAIKSAQLYGTLALKSLPTNADIYIDGTSMGLQTPETFKKLSVGPHEVAVSKFNSKTGTTDVYATTIEIIPGQKKEVMLHIPAGVGDDLVNPGNQDQSSGPQLPDFITTTVLVSRCIDGDTFITSFGETVRILGMDAPETGQPIAAESKAFMESKILEKKVDIKIQTHLPIDTYGRTLAITTYRDETVAVSSIAAGLAKAKIFNDATYDPTRYLEAETLAQQRKIGIWDPKTPPIVWRP